MQYRDTSQEADELCALITGIGAKEINAASDVFARPDYWELGHYDHSAWEYGPLLRCSPKRWEKQPKEKIIHKWDADQPDKRSYGCRVYLDDKDHINIEKDGKTIPVPGGTLLDISTDCKMALYMDLYLDIDTDNNNRDADHFLIMDLENGESRRVSFHCPTDKGVYYRSMKFVGSDGKIVEAQSKDVGSLLLIETGKGRSLSEILYPAEEGWGQGGRAEGFLCPNGPVKYRPNGMGAVAISLPQTDCDPPYMIKKLKTYHDIRDEQEELTAAFVRAEEAFTKNAFDEAKEYLMPYSISGAIVHHEEALRLWTKLGHFFEHTKLVAVIPTSDAPDPDRTCDKPFAKEPWTDKLYKNNISDGIVSMHAECSFEEVAEGTGTDIYCYLQWSLTGVDAEDKTCKVFDIPIVHTFVDHAFDTDGFNPWDTNLYMHFLEDGTLCWGYNNDKQGKLSDPELQRSFPEGMIFYLPAGVRLQNTKEGLRIGSLLFDDEFEGCYPLYNAEIIPGKKQNYRLVYQYGGRKDDL